jgi:hypothetical protein
VSAKISKNNHEKPPTQKEYAFTVSSHCGKWARFTGRQIESEHNLQYNEALTKMIIRF